MVYVITGLLVVRGHSSQKESILIATVMDPVANEEMSFVKIQEVTWMDIAQELGFL